MIQADARLTIRRVPLECLQITEHASCDIQKVVKYTQLLQDNPGHDMEPLITCPSPTHVGMLAIKNGKHRFLSYILAQRIDAPCVVIEEGK